MSKIKNFSDTSQHLEHYDVLKRQIHMAESLINDVSDTAIWVAHYRAEESKRPNALFKDPWAEKLAGLKGERIASQIGNSHTVGWSVVIRTKVIDTFIEELVANGVDTVVNLGAGLDSRPYRLHLPESLQWVEVDYPHLIDFKNRVLGKEKAGVQLKRIGLDLAQREARQKLFRDIASRSQKILVLTEGVVPYLSSEQVSELANDLRTKLKCKYWIVDYFSSRLMRYFKYSTMRRHLKKAPFQFFPSDYFGFFERAGWMPQQIRYLSDESRTLGREIPLSRLSRFLAHLMSTKNFESLSRTSAYVVLEPNKMK